MNSCCSISRLVLSIFIWKAGALWRENNEIKNSQKFQVIFSLLPALPHARYWWVSSWASLRKKSTQNEELFSKRRQGIKQEKKWKEFSETPRHQRRGALSKVTLEFRVFLKRLVAADKRREGIDALFGSARHPITRLPSFGSGKLKMKQSRRNGNENEREKGNFRENLWNDEENVIELGANLRRVKRLFRFWEYDDNYVVT